MQEIIEGHTRVYTYFGKMKSDLDDILKGMHVSVRPCPDCSTPMYTDGNSFICAKCKKKIHKGETRMDEYKRGRVSMAETAQIQEKAKHLKQIGKTEEQIIEDLSEEHNRSPEAIKNLICQDQPQEQKQKNAKLISSLDQIMQEIKNLEREIRSVKIQISSEKTRVTLEG